MPGQDVRACLMTYLTMPRTSMSEPTVCVLALAHSVARVREVIILPLSYLSSCPAWQQHGRPLITVKVLLVLIVLSVLVMYSTFQHGTEKWLHTSFQAFRKGNGLIPKPLSVAILQLCSPSQGCADSPHALCAASAQVLWVGQ